MSQKADSDALPSGPRGRTLHRSLWCGPRSPARTMKRRLPEMAQAMVPAPAAAPSRNSLPQTRARRPSLSASVAWIASSPDGHAAGTDRQRPRPAARNQLPSLALLTGRSGNRRRRVPVSAKNAFATAGAIGGSAGSPAPPGSSSLSMRITSTSGISLMRSIG